MATGLLQLQQGGRATTGIRTWNTPHRLHAALIAIAVGAAVFFLVVMVTTSQLQYAINTVSKDAAPSIIAAQHIRADLANMDANAANEMIAKPGDNLDAIKAYADSRKDAVDNIVKAAQNITYDSERDHILAIAEGLAKYEGLIAQARSFHERGDAAMLASYRQATILLHTLLDEAVKLDKVNNDELENAYARQRIVTMLLVVVVMAFGGILVFGLVATQLFLARRFKRTINPGLFAATALAGIFLLMTLVQLLQASAALKLAKQDAFDSIHALWQARAIAFDANGDESRWLLDRPWTDRYEKSFFANANQLVKLQPGQQVDAESAARSQGKDNPEPFFAKEINNITFAGEEDAAKKMLQFYGQYFVIDGQIRKLQFRGDKDANDAAVALCIGMDEGESNWAFDHFDSALGETMKINQDQFDRATTNAATIVHRIALLNPFVALGIVVLAFVGLRARIQEYA